MRITPTKRGKLVASCVVGTLLTTATITAFTLEPKPWDSTTTPTQNTAPIMEHTPTDDPYQEAWTVEELLMTCDNDYKEGSDVWEACVDTILTATCMFEPFSEDSEWFTAADARCSGGRVTSSTPVITG